MLTVIVQHKGSLTYDKYIEECLKSGVKAADKHLFTHLVGVYYCSLAAGVSESDITSRSNKYTQFLNTSDTLDHGSKETCCGGGQVR